jgi:threonine dehydratase
MHASVQAGRIIRLTEEPTLADALAGGLGARNRYTFRLCRELVDEIVLVSEEEIAAAMCYLFETHRLVIEGGGAVGVAALLARRVACGGATAVVLSGGNVDLSILLDITRRPRGAAAGRH